MIQGCAAQLKRFCPGMQLHYLGIMKLCSPNTRFQWNDELTQELENLKQCLRDHVKISPIDTSKNLEMVIDSAATIGTSYLLLQRKTEDPADGFNFIGMDSANFRKGQLSLCPFEAEVVGLRYACRKENHYLQACPEVLVVTDCKELMSTYKKPLETIKNRQVQKMLLDICHLNLTFEHISGIKNCTADFRSRRPRDSYEAISEEEVPTKLRLGVRTVKAQKLQIDLIDPRVERLAEVGRSDAKYQRMFFHTEEETPDNRVFLSDFR